MEGKLAQLQAATDEAEKQVLENLRALDDATQRVKVAKSLLRSLDAEEQEKILVTDTKLPELLDLLAHATEKYETSQKKYETNMKYLALLKLKMGSSAGGQDDGVKKDKT
uniref:Uncharacterized protein n=1 Tax=Trieres chinensis TaxID=1514140 RepID=A0A7S1ZQ15_TRICV|mmetsp:Transcript_30630/g.62537  ORF Transcript_30630/g.62537 Transcript_30630/m.62537 type:complete len:110 (+) Transcript_30630:39-368(+)|eukprot:CAMPEP_0183297208 /NCGR_PEP_ID=MMETSP0160_2-20130417/4559_1 /TAXON_ID=2839 ORGANISM="Odontella Sinensis, Strain Grunow 1884" /NCGR_SAMPLE_ID=MMETSP0160_2 /ASSEMBLY_ACC=CAM_ASM_000250 /LENGTH=109 /DNA_ID=CAMNT_0025458981 /DNA_START=168 /DNA_END=497 /DNA_ORIENTATION=+